MLIERAIAADLPELPEIEREAGVAFKDWDVPAAEFAAVTSLDELRHALDAGLLWVARDAGRPIGFALVEFVDGLPHLEEIDVRPSHGRRGIGRALVAAVLDWARDAGHAAVTLTSFRDVPWNAPFYARLGFRILEPAELTPGLAEILRDEAARGFDPARRVAMRRGIMRAAGPHMTNIVIRRAGLADVAAVAALVAGFRDFLHAKAPSDAEIQRDLPRALADPGIEFCCAWLADLPVGYTQTRFWTSVWAGGLEAQLDDLFVIAEARGRGVGRALLRHALARAGAHGARRFALNTNESNERAQALYRSEGLAPQSHALYPGGREVLWTRNLVP